MLSDLNQVYAIKEVASQTFRVDESKDISTKVDSRKMFMRPNFYDSVGDSSIVLSIRPIMSPKPTNISDLERFKNVTKSNLSQLYDRVPAKELSLKKFSYMNKK